MTSLFSIYPNPNSGEFMISSQKDLHLVLVTELGQEVRSFDLKDSNSHRVSVSDLAAGIYFIVASGSEGNISRKIVVQK
jgi:hypothetical protein